MGDRGTTGALARKALVALVLASGAISGVASATSTSATLAPTVTKVRARAMASAGAKTAWVLTAAALDSDTDLVGGLVKIRVGANGQVLTRRITSAKDRSTSSRGTFNLKASGITSATLTGSALRVAFFASPAPGPLTLTFWVSDAKQHFSNRVALYLKVKANQTVTITATNPVAAEPSTQGTLTVTRSGGSTAVPLTVFYTVSGTATAGTDYTALPGSVTIPAGKSSAEIAVSPIDDETIEPSKSVVAVLTAKPSYIVGTPNTAFVTITSDDVVASVAIAASEPSAAEPSNPGSFTVTRTGGTTASLVVSYTTTGTATAGIDYTSLPSSVTIPAGESTATIAVTPIDDNIVESPETVVATLRISSRYTIGVQNSATVTITDNDAVASVTIAATDSSAAEPSNTGLFIVTRTGSTTTPITVPFALGGTATAGTDYSTQPTSSLTIPAGSSSATITVTPIDDTIVESTETVVVTLSAGSGYTVGSSSSATVTIADDEPTVTIAATDAAAAEPSDPGTFTVTRTGSTALPLTVFYTVSGTATNGSDFTALPGSVTIPAGQSSVTITVSPIDDTTVEGPETVIVTLVATSSYAIGSASDATVTIADND